MYNNFFFLFENRAVYEIMRKNIVQPDRPQMTIWGMRIARWIPEATNTHSEYVTLIVLHCDNGCKKAPQNYVIPALSLYLWFRASCLIVK